jgi:hypothetical protein
MRVGIHERTFVKNVVAIGLSAGFIEPLESNGLYTVHEFLFKLIKTLERPAVTQWDKDVYNGSCFAMWRNFAEFVALHYALSIRNDTEYWKANANRTYSPGMVSMSPDTAIGFYKLQSAKMFDFRNDSNIAGINWIGVGMNYFVLDKTTLAVRQNHFHEDFKIGYANIFNMFEERKARWKESAKNHVSLYQYLKTHIHKGQD